MDAGAIRAGLEIIWANDSDKHSCDTYKKNLGSHIVYGSIEDNLGTLKELGAIDAVIGGPPCQGYSVAGKMKPNDPRSKLVFTFMKVVSINSPKFFVMENVGGLGKLDKFSEVREELYRIARTLGYDAKIVLVNSKDYQCPTSRERMFFVGFRDSDPRIFEKILEKKKILREVPSVSVFKKLGPAGTNLNPKTCNAAITLASKPILRKSPYAGMLFNGLGRPVNPNRPCATLPASMGGNKTPIVDENQIWGDGKSWVESYHQHLMEEGKPYDWDSTPDFLRRLTTREASLLQTFPESYEFSGPNSAVYRQLGNCVPCSLAYNVVDAAVQTMSLPNSEHGRDLQEIQGVLPIERNWAK